VTPDYRLSNVEAALRRLQRQETAIPETVQPGYYWLDSVVTVQASTSSTVAWTTYNAAHDIPQGTKAVLLEIEFAMDSPDSGDSNAHVRFRRRSGEIELVGARGAAGGSSDSIAWCNEKLVPVTKTRTFDYSIETPGFNNGCEIRLIGYYK